MRSQCRGDHHHYKPVNGGGGDSTLEVTMSDFSPKQRGHLVAFSEKTKKGGQMVLRIRQVFDIFWQNTSWTKLSKKNTILTKCCQKRSSFSERLSKFGCELFKKKRSLG